ncbi:unnamed protein product, partial [Mesorhabditis belari]|uniref:Transcription elongation factor n=1 Tax=Mesorhabditis belari TaxID=2138241 RepID=A0AAF3F4A9_9BILA
MSCEEEVLKIGKKLNKLIESQRNDEALDVLGALSKMPITVDILSKTRIGMTLNELRKKTNDEKLAKKAKTLIKDWKNLVDNGGTKDAKNGKDEKSNTNALRRNDSSSSSLAQKVTTPAPTTTAPLKLPTSAAASFSGSFPPKHLETDEFRIKACEMLLQALKSGELPDGTLDPEEMAIKIEDKLFAVHKSSGDKYRGSLRSRVFNLKKNTALRENVLTAVVTPEKFATMSSEEMASEEIRKEREKFTQEAIRDAQVSVQQGTPSDMFKCGKCKKNNCTYNQLQTRSADEPMTTFVFCLECGNRWKFC